MNDLNLDCFLSINGALLLAVVICRRTDTCETDVLLCQDRICIATPTNNKSNGAANMHLKDALPVYVNPTNIIDMWNYGV